MHVDGTAASMYTVNTRGNIYRYKQAPTFLLQVKDLP